MTDKVVVNWRDLSTLDMVLSVLDFAERFTSDAIQSEVRAAYDRLRKFRETIREEEVSDE